MKKAKMLSLTAGLVLAISFTLSCSSDENGGGGGNEPTPSSNSSGGETVFCKQNSGVCSQLSLSTCMELVNTGVAQIVSSCDEPPPPPPSSSSNNEPSGNYCGGTSYNPSSQFCDNNAIYQKCGGEQYRPSSEFCSGNTIYQKCNSENYSPTTHVCTEYGLLKIAKIGTQTWMAENLNRNWAGSKCYDNNSANCGKYGRLFDWATAMKLPASCNTNSCSSQISAKHQGICPDGWHIPTEAEWDILTNYAGGESNAGRKLKARSGWSDSGNGTDDYGFSALPGGYGNLDGFFLDGSGGGYWWSATEIYSNYYAYYREMHHYDSFVFRDYYNKSYYLFSVRCVQN